MGDWKIVVPYEGYNLFTDPSFAYPTITNSISVFGDGTGYSVDQYLDDAMFGASCAQITLGTSGTYLRLYKTVVTGGAIPWVISCYVKRSGGGVVTDSHILMRHHGVGGYSPTIEYVGNGWYRAYYSAGGSGTPTQYEFYLMEDGMLIDGIQLEPCAYGPSTFLEGSQPGCWWSGQPFASRSYRHANTRRGGAILDMKDDLGFGVVEVVGTEATDEDVSVESYAGIPGGIMTGMSKKPRTFALTGNLTATPTTTLSERINTLRKYLDRESQPGSQPVTLWYTGATTWKRIEAFYVSGFQGAFPIESTNTKTMLKLSIQFLAPDPNWYYIGNGVLNTNGYESLIESANTNFSVYGYNWQWHDWNGLGVTTSPGGVYSMALGPDNCLYVVGSFTNWNNTTGRNRIAKYDIFADSWTTVGSTGAFADGIIYDIAIHPDGTIYVGGSFTISGGSPGDYLAKFNGTSWSAVVSGGTGPVYALGLDWFSSQTLWVGGNFANFGTVTYADNLCWVADLKGTPYVVDFDTAGANNYVYAITPDPLNERMLIGGLFTTVDGSNFNYLCQVDVSSGGAGGYTPSVLGQAYNDLSTNGYVYAIEIDQAGNIIIGGAFTSAGGDTNCDRVAIWTGYDWQDIGDTSLLSTIKSIGVGPDGRIWLLDDGGSYWDLYFSYNRTLHWTHTFGMSASSDPAKRIVILPYDQDNPGGYTIYFGSTVAGSCITPAAETIDYIGSARAWPILIFNNLEESTNYKYFRWIWNHATGKHLTATGSSGLSIQPGDVVNWNLTPGKQEVVSQLKGKLANTRAKMGSDIGEIYLVPGSNNLSIFTANVTNSTMSLIWPIAYNGMSD